MKKSLIALAVLAAAGTASAQSSVTLFGVVDAAVQHVSNSGGAKGTRMTQGAYQRSRLGVRGSEDLGGGMSASFWLEGDVSVDDGTGSATNTNNQSTGAAGGTGLTWNSRATVSLAGGWGELRLGRDYTPGFWNLNLFDPFGVRGVGVTQLLTGYGALPNGGITSVRASNMIGYFLPPNLGGFYGQVGYWLGENASGGPNSRDGRGVGTRLGYAAGPFNVAFAYERTRYAVGDLKRMNLGGSWDFGMAKLMGGVARDESGALDGKGWMLGTLVPVGAGEIRLAFDQYKTGASAKARKLALGYVHNLSKRTALYATYARVRNTGGSNSSVIGGTATAQFGLPGVNQSSSGYDLGIKHSF
jgi:predicted porin